jgi:hypothetical protein
MKQQDNLKKKRAALILFGAAFILLVANLVVDVPEENKSIETGKSLNYKEIDSLFHVSLKNLGLPEKCIQNRKKSKIPYSYRIKIPTDLSIPVVLAEINQVFSGSYVSINANEKSFNGLTLLEISLEKSNVLVAELNYDDEAKRSGGTIAFVIDNFKLSVTDDSLLLDIPEPFSCLLIPHSKNIEVIKFLKSKNKTYTLLLNDDIPELKYKLNKNYSLNRLKGPILSIINDFSDAASIFIDDNSELFNSAALLNIRNELSKRKIHFNDLSKLHAIDSDSDEQLINGFENLMKTAGKNNSLIILVSQEEFRTLLSEIKKYKKLGYKIVHPTELLEAAN